MSNPYDGEIALIVGSRMAHFPLVDPPLRTLCGRRIRERVNVKGLPWGVICKRCIAKVLALPRLVRRGKAAISENDEVVA